MSQSGLADRWHAAAPYLLSVLRILAAFVYIEYGTAKLFKYPFTVIHFSPGILTSIAGPLETIGGTLLLVGLFSRPVAFILSGEMAVAYFHVHAPRAFWPISNSGQSAVLFCFIWLYISAAGPGRLSLDWLWRRPKTALAPSPSSQMVAAGRESARPA